MMNPLDKTRQELIVKKLNEVIEWINEREEREEAARMILSDNSKKEKVAVSFTDNEFITLALEAHKRDITFNRLCTELLEEYIAKHGTR